MLLFTSRRFASLTPSVRRLRAFDRVALAPGESRSVTFTLTTDDLMYVGRDGRPVLEGGRST